LAHRDIRARRVAGNNRDRRLVTHILTRKCRFAGELFPELERLRLMHEGKETGYGPQCLRLGRAQVYAATASPRASHGHEEEHEHDDTASLSEFEPQLRGRGHEIARSHKSKKEEVENRMETTFYYSAFRPLS